MPIIGGTPDWMVIGLVPIRILQANERRVSFTLYCPATNAGVVYVAYGLPNVTVAGPNRGFLIGAGGLAIEAAPDVYTGDVYAIATLAAQDLMKLETMREAVST